MHPVSASIVVYNNEISQIRDCVDSIQQDCPVSIYIVDNSEIKGAYASLASSDVTVIDAPGNIGFGRGHNLAIAYLRNSGSRMHLVVNPDIVAKAGSVTCLANFMEAHEDVALAGPRIVSPSGQLYRSCKLLPTPWNLFARRFAPRFLYEKSDARYELRQFACDRVVRVSNLSGAFLAFRTEIFVALNGFDPRYFMYLEDVDICRRAGNLGSLAFQPKAEVIHEHGQGSYRSLKLLLAHVRSAKLYFDSYGWFFDEERRKLNRAALADIDRIIEAAAS